jgi:ribosomal protein S18 acetylase RimI-like enzyme
MFGTADLPNGIRLRPATAADNAFQRMLHDANRWDLAFVDGDAELVQSLLDMQHAAQTEGYGAQHPEALYYIIEKTGTACGRLVLDFSAGEVRIVDIALMPEAQDTGIGPTVLGAVQTVAGQIGAPVVAMTQRINTGAIRAYQRLGFHAAAHQPNPAFVVMTWSADERQD